MQLFVRGTKTHVVELEGSSTVADLKVALAPLEGLEVTSQVLSYEGSPLEDASPLAAAGIAEDATLDLTCRLVGGKVHGSLARAGKVRGQTPKVDAQEKKKKKTGRAKRRIQYNRRFVNVVATFGRKRGPNSNQQPT